jgi:peroxiredoxin
VAFSGSTDDPVLEAAREVDRLADQQPPPLAIETRLRAAEALTAADPAFALELKQKSLRLMLDAKVSIIGSGGFRILSKIAPEDAQGILPLLPADVGYPNELIQAFVDQGHVDDAVSLYRSQLKRSSVVFQKLSLLLQQLAADRPNKARDLYHESINSFSFDHASAEDAWWLLQSLPAMAPLDAEVTAVVARKLFDLAISANWGDDETLIQAQYGVGPQGLTTQNSALSIAIGSLLCLRALDSSAFSRRAAIFGSKVSAISSLSGAEAIKAAHPTNIRLIRPRYDAHTDVERQLKTAIAQVRALTNSYERARRIVSLATQIRSLPTDSFKLTLAQMLGHMSTEGDVGKESLQAVAGTLALAINEQHPALLAARVPWSYGEDYLHLANMIRYEHLDVPDGAPPLGATMALLQLQEMLDAKLDFTLPDLDGNAHTLSSLRGNVVLLGFTATRCPPCLSQLEILDKLQKRYSKQGLVVLAISLEDREKLRASFKDRSYSFPVLEDVGGKVFSGCGIEQIPRTLIYNRDGGLAGQAIDARTERQLLAMLKAAGLD